MHVALIAKPGFTDTGVGRYTVELEKALRTQGHKVTILHPFMPLPKWLAKRIRQWLGWDLQAFFNNYPVWARYPDADLYHITSQNLATLMLLCPPPGKTVVTVHDIIPWTLKDCDLRTYRHKIDEWFDWLALRGIERCRDIITDSDFTTRSVSRTLKITDSNIQTVYLGLS